MVAEQDSENAKIEFSENEALLEYLADILVEAYLKKT